MGCCYTTPNDVEIKPEPVENKQIEMKSKQYVTKLLMLGTGSSGKTTIFKQLQYIYGNGYETKDRAIFSHHVQSQVFDSMKKLIDSCEIYYEDNPDMYPQLNLAGHTNYNDEIKEAMDEVMTMNSEYRHERKIEFIKMVWNYEPIKEMFKLRNEVCIKDSLEYFMNKVDDIFKPDYIPSKEDLIMVDVRTTGMHDKLWEYESNKFKVMDTGGQRNERKLSFIYVF